MGEVCAGDVLWSWGERSDNFLVQIQEFLEVVLRSGEELFLVSGSMHEQVRDGVFDPKGSACLMEFHGDAAACLFLWAFMFCC